MTDEVLSVRNHALNDDVVVLTSYNCRNSFYCQITTYGLTIGVHIDSGCTYHVVGADDL